MTDLVSQLVGALNRLYVAAPTGLECNSFHHSKGEFHSHSEPCKPAAEYVEALAQARAALTAAKAGGWVPIETAPKDGTVVLLCRGERVTAGHWEPERWPTEAEYHSSTGEYLGSFETGECIDAWWYSADGGFSEDEPPTHWHPLPTPPKEQA